VYPSAASGTFEPTACYFLTRFVKTLLVSLIIPFAIEDATTASHLIRKEKVLLNWYVMNYQIQVDPRYFTCLPNVTSQWNYQR
jgi:hypothetical protein